MMLVDSSGTMSGGVEAFFSTVYLFLEGQASGLASFFVLVSFVRIGKSIRCGKRLAWVLLANRFHPK